MNAGFEALAAIIATATVLSFVARKTKQPTVIAYIASGLILGPVGLSLLGETEMTALFSELGLVFLLFFIGLEIDLSDIREILRPTIIIGVGQMALTALLGYATGILLGFTFIESVFLAAASMFSSTALVVKLLTDKDESSTLPGRLDVGILLIQDVAVVMILAMLTASFTDPSTALLRIGEIVAMIGLIGGISLASSRFLLPRIFKKSQSSERAFFIYGLGWAFLLITGAGMLDLSLEIGAFFAGLSLAQLPYSSELQERVRPLTDLFMAVFFVNFGLSILPGQLAAYFFEAIAASAILMVGKFGILYGLIDRLKFTPETSFKASLNMTQISEFSLILGSLAATQGYISNDMLGFISLVAITTMGLSSYLLNYNQKIYDRVDHIAERFSTESESSVDVNMLRDHAIVIGYNMVTENLIDLLEREYGQVVIVDNDPSNVKELSEIKHEYIYGDFNHGEIRTSSGLEKAAFVLSLANDKEVAHHVLRERGRDTRAFLEAGSFEEAAEIYERGAEYVILENTVSADKVSDYIELYMKDPALFDEEVEEDLETIYWGGRRNG